MWGPGKPAIYQQYIVIDTARQVRYGHSMRKIADLADATVKKLEQLQLWVADDLARDAGARPIVPQRMVIEMAIIQMHRSLAAKRSGRKGK